MVTTRETPTPANFGDEIGEAEYSEAVAEHVHALWQSTPLPLESFAGTDVLTAVVTPALDDGYHAGMSFWGVILNNNLGPVTLDINGQGIRNVLRPSGDPLGVDDLKAGTAVQFLYDGTAFRVMDPVLDFVSTVPTPPDPDARIDVIAGGSLASGNTDITDIPQIYKYLTLALNNATPNANNVQRPTVRFSFNNGSSFPNSLFYGVHAGSIFVQSNVIGASSSIAGEESPTAAAAACSIFGYQTGSSITGQYFTSIPTGSPKPPYGVTYTVFNTGGVDAIRIAPSAGTFSAGTYVLCGVY